MTVHQVHPWPVPTMERAQSRQSELGTRLARHGAYTRENVSLRSRAIEPATIAASVQNLLYSRVSGHLRRALRERRRRQERPTSQRYLSNWRLQTNQILTFTHVKISFLRN